MANENGNSFGIETEMDSSLDSQALVKMLTQVSLLVSQSKLSSIKKIGKYDVSRFIYSGAQSTTFEAFDTELERRVLLKMYNCHSSLGDRRLAVQEGRLLSKINSPYVATCFGIEWFEDKPVLVLEYVDGETITEYVKGNDLSSEQLEELIRKFASGLQAVHAQGIVHRDIKSSNIMVDEEGQPKIIDFGLSIRSGLSTSTTGSGTFAYLAPEIASGNSSSNEKSDVFGFGAVLYELMLGQPPYSSHCRNERLLAAANHQISFSSSRLNDYPTLLKSILADCLESDPENRPGSRELVRRLENRPGNNWLKLFCFTCMILGLVLVISKPGNRNQFETTGSEVQDANSRNNSIENALAVVNYAEKDCEWLVARRKKRQGATLASLIDHSVSARFKFCCADQHGIFHFKPGQQLDFIIQTRKTCFIAIYRIVKDESRNQQATLVFPELSLNAREKSNGAVELGAGATTIPLQAIDASSAHEIHVVVKNRAWDPTTGKYLPFRGNRGVEASTWEWEAIFPVSKDIKTHSDIRYLEQGNENFRIAVKASQSGQPLVAKQHFLDAVWSISQHSDPHVVWANRREILDAYSNVASIEFDQGNLIEQTRLMQLAVQFLMDHGQLTGEKRIFDRQYYRAKKLLSADEKQFLNFKIAMDDYKSGSRGFRLGNEANAIDLIEQAKARFDLLFGERNEYSRDCILLLAKNASKSGDVRETRRLFRRACEMTRGMYSQEHGEYANVLFAYGQCEFDSGNYQAAMLNFRSAVKIYERSQPAKRYHLKFAWALNQFAEALNKLTENRDRNFLVQYGDIIGQAKTRFDEFSLDCPLLEAAILENLAQFAWLKQDVASAIRHQSKAESIREVNFGPTDLLTVNSKVWLACFKFCNAESEFNSDVFNKVADMFVAETLISDCLQIIDMIGETGSLTYVRALNVKIGIDFRFGRLEEARHSFAKLKKVAQQREEQWVSNTMKLIEMRLAATPTGNPWDMIAKARELSNKIPPHDQSDRYLKHSILDMQVNGFEEASKIAWQPFSQVFRREAARLQEEVFALRLANCCSTESDVIPSKYDIVRLENNLGLYLQLAISCATEAGSSNDSITALRMSLEVDHFADQVEKLAAIDAIKSGVIQEIKAELFHSRQVGTLNSVDFDAPLPDAGSKNKLSARNRIKGLQFDMFRKFARSLHKDSVCVVLRPSSRRNEARLIHRQYEAFVIKGDNNREPGFSVSWIELGDAGTIDALVNEYQSSFMPEVGRKLRRVLWDRVEAHFPNDCEYVLLKVGGDLARVSFDALPTDDANGKDESQYLVERFKINRIVDWESGLRVQNNSKSKMGLAKRVVSVGNLDFGEVERELVWRNLIENDNISSRLSEWAESSGMEFSHLSGLDFRSEEISSLGHARLVHLATHGCFLGDRIQKLNGDLRSLFWQYPGASDWLVLSNGNMSPEDILTAHEVLGFSLPHCRLLILAGCSTGVGFCGPSGNSFSLSNCFSRAGVQIVIGSLWDVDDLVTVAFFEEFYSRLIDDGLCPAEALRETKLWMINGNCKEAGFDSRHSIGNVRHWAAWTLTGDWRQ